MNFTGFAPVFVIFTANLLKIYIEIGYYFMLLPYLQESLEILHKENPLG